MRGIYTPVTDIRRKVFTEVARMSYESNEMADYAKEIRDLPFKIMPGEDSSLRSSIFLERAIVSERIRLAMGLSLRPVTESVSATEDLEHSVIADKYYEPPLINVIKFACNKCPEKIIKVTSMCQGCLAHPCQEVCPKKAISFRNGRSHIDQDLCRARSSTRTSAASAACARRPARTTPSSRWSAPAPRLAALVLFVLTSMAAQILITTSAYPAVCAWSTARSALSWIRARSSS